MNRKVLPFIIALCALGLGATAAYYSIIGLSKLFAGAATAVIVMASFLELSKLTTAVTLHTYWNKLSILLRTYLTSAVIVLSIITSIGIYGMLSEGYQQTYLKSTISDSKIELLETKKENIQTQLLGYKKEKETLSESLNSLRGGLSNNKIQYVDKETGQLVTTTSSRTRNSLEKQINKSLNRQDKINSKIDSLNTIIFNTESKISETKINAEASSELGPLKYLASVTGKPMDKIINVLLIIIILVFDPLAIILVISASFTFSQINKPKKKPLTEPTKSQHIETVDEEPEPEPEDELEPEPEPEPDKPKLDPKEQKKQEILQRKDLSGWRKRKLIQEIEGGKDLTINY